MQALMPILFVVLVAILSSVAEARKRYIFRLDDMEDYYNSDVQISILNYFMDNNVAFSAGIIGGFFSGDDVPLYQTLQRCAQMSKDRCALFNHGRDAAYLFGQASSVAEAKAEIKYCDDQIKSLFPGYHVEMMVPHQNSWGQYLLQALRELGYVAVSASTDSYSNMPYDLTANPIQIPQQTTSADYADDGSWLPFSPAKTFSDCEAADARGEDCVIMIHPHEFADGVYTFTMLTQLINLFKTNGWTNVNFHTIIAEQLGTGGGTSNPTARPSIRPSAVPTRTPTRTPTRSPTAVVTVAPTVARTAAPSVVPTAIPTARPTVASTVTPTVAPSAAQTVRPTTTNSVTPSVVPTVIPSARPTVSNTAAPSFARTATPSTRPTTPAPTSSQPPQVAWGQCGGVSWTGPTTCVAGYECQFQSQWYSQCVPSTTTRSPTRAPTRSPTRAPTRSPTATVTNTRAPTIVPTRAPSIAGTTAVTATPTQRPSMVPTAIPTRTPTQVPSTVPTTIPTRTPTLLPTAAFTTAPTRSPTSAPTVASTVTPTIAPTVAAPTRSPTVSTTATPSRTPTTTPTVTPSFAGNQGGQYTCTPFTATNTNGATMNTVSCTIVACRSHTVEISMLGSAILGAPVCSGDTILRIFNGNGAEIASNNDFNGNTRCSQLSFVTTQQCSRYTIVQGCAAAGSCAGTTSVAYYY
jgi:hypothetical protein